jgi:hypothetical protein
MKLCVVSPFAIAPRLEILNFLAGITADLILLPGGSRNTPSHKNAQAVIRPKVSVFVQGDGSKKQRTPYLVTSRTVSKHSPDKRVLLPSLESTSRNGFYVERSPAGSAIGHKLGTA